MAGRKTADLTKVPGVSMFFGLPTDGCVSTGVS